ncbi:hypothetical protein MLD38_038593 [Melastoma candidum]|uniref:Uncharacterized protein n=1 Tax=Melastoma candidum TaxID=119954 RepID=A0ACB9KZQ2_9MYRT|nr:hypothetical protein MLD38_038593 [Melastoma candidum]
MACWFRKLTGFTPSARSVKALSDESIGKSRELPKWGSVVHRDELTVKKRNRSARPLGLVGREGRDEKNGGGEKGVRMRVKLKLTKGEAERLLLKCKEGGVLEFGDVADELGRIPESRIVSMDVISRGDVVGLASIPEEKHGFCDDL